jgi:high-affinity K+ transport system ATPase subunit B
MFEPIPVPWPALLALVLAALTFAVLATVAEQRRKAAATALLNTQANVERRLVEVADEAAQVVRRRCLGETQIAVTKARETALDEGYIAGYNTCLAELDQHLAAANIKQN